VDFLAGTVAVISVMVIMFRVFCFDYRFPLFFTGVSLIFPSFAFRRII
jgi:hypothetical protein